MRFRRILTRLLRPVVPGPRSAGDAPQPVPEREPVSEDAVRTLVSELYYHLLRRAPDQTGLTDHSHALLNDPSVPAITRLIQAFASSEEARGKTRMVADDVQNAGRIISLGTHCATAWALKSAQLKTASYPFDWIFSNSSMVIHCLEDDFEVLLDQQYHLTSGHGPCDHIFYRDRFGVTDLFNHRAPEDQESYAYYRRCVDRFRADAPEPGNLFLMLGREDKVRPSDFEALSSAITAISPARRLLMIVVDPPVGSVSAAGFTRLAGNADGTHRCVRYTPTSDLGPLQFVNQIDNLLISAVLQNRG